MFTSHAFKSGDLKMVKVRRGKRGHRQSRSLVFRISRTAKTNSDDSGIKCSSTDEETSTHTHSPLQNKGTVEYVRSEHQVFQEDPSDSRMDAPNPNEADFRSNRSILCPRILKGTIAETKLNEPRRSSRRIVLRVQKEAQPNYPVKEPPKGPHTFAFGPSRRNEPQVCLGEKKKRGRKPAVRGTECTKKRKYGRRGRPPKFPKQLSLVKAGGGPNEKVVIMAPPKNSVWTLVPKELVESEFFKRQLLRATQRNPVQEKDPKRPTVIYFKKKCEPSKTENDMLYLFNKYRMFQDIILKNYYELAGGNLNATENMLSNFLSKTSDVSRAIKAEGSGEQKVNSYSHEAASHPQPSRFLPFLAIWRRDSLGRPVLLLLPSGDHVRGLRVGSNVFDLNSAAPASRPVRPGSEPPPSGDPCRSSEVRDTLCRQIIFQSLQILYSDEAVLR